MLPLVDVAVSHSDPHLEPLRRRVWKLLQDLHLVVVALDCAQETFPARKCFSQCAGASMLGMFVL